MFESMATVAMVDDAVAELIYAEWDALSRDALLDAVRCGAVRCGASSRCVAGWRRWITG